MKKLRLTKGYFALLDDADAALMSVYKWTAQVDRRKDGSVRIVYARRNSKANEGKRRKLYLHRELLGISEHGIDVDHVDNDGLNNQRSNLRECRRSQNLGNQRTRVDNTSGYKGVTWSKADNKWQAQIQFNNKHRSLGNFDSPEKAAIAYNEAAAQLFGEFAKINKKGDLS